MKLDKLYLKPISYGKKSNRVGFSVNQEEVWFESDSIALTPTPQAAISAFFLQSLKTGLPLQTKQAAGHLSVNNLTKIARQSKLWWNTQQHFSVTHKLFTLGSKPKVNARRRTALCFSCGVDSFDTLLTHDQLIDDLVLIHGFDIPLTNESRFNKLRAHAQEVADEMGKRLVCVKTNLRECLFFKKISWEQSHGGALAAIGHLLVKEVDRFLISASFSKENLQAWGSSPLLDPHWSNDYLRIIHLGEALSRSQKIRMHGFKKPLQDHLVICWQGKTSEMNCGHCEKCVRSQLALLSGGIKELPKTFSLEHKLTSSIDSIKKIAPHMIPTYEFFLEYGLDSDIAISVQALIERSSDN